MKIDYYFYILTAAILTVTHVLAIISAFDAVMKTRTSQGAIAWSISLVTFPYVTLPLYWIFGRSRFYGYVNARRAGNLKIQDIARTLAAANLADHRASLDDDHDQLRVLESLVNLPFTNRNSVQLLVDGSAWIDAIFGAIRDARKYVLLQFFIVRDDKIGSELREILQQKAAEGVQIYFLYDEIGSHQLSAAYVRELATAGITIYPFKTTRGYSNRFQLNFRNHRKLVVVDGEIAFIGGSNIGDEYLGRNPRIGNWRDTNIRLVGPSVQCIQLSFIEDWYWAAKSVPDLQWTPTAGCTDRGSRILILPTGPADALESCGLYYAHMINSAKSRIWIASPYFVPDGRVIGALQMAGLRGVDVRVVLPEKPDQLLVYLAAFSYLELSELIGIKIYRYQAGFLHHKVVLIDDTVASVGTANFDKRSFRLNFEISALVIDKEFASQVLDMFERDFERCRETSIQEYRSRPWWFFLAVRVARLFSPIL